MSTQTLSPQARRFLDDVADSLSWLTEDERTDLLTDLEAHLSELEPGAITATLGDPETFVQEFLASAGLDHPTSSGRKGRRAVRRANRVRRTRASRDRLRHRLDRTMAPFLTHPLAEDTRAQWRAFRPAWVWIRGWLLVAVAALLTNPPGFERFPIPLVANSTIYGVGAVVALTIASRRIAAEGNRAVADRWFTRTALAAVGLSALFGVGVRPQVVHVEGPPPDVEPIGQAPRTGVRNVFAYDRQGNPVDVLLYDQDGSPLSLIDPDRAEQEPGMEGLWITSNGWVRPALDVHDRPVWNLYPLEFVEPVMDDEGTTDLDTLSPPVIGIPELREAPVAADTEEPIPR